MSGSDGVGRWASQIGEWLLSPDTPFLSHSSLNPHGVYEYANRDAN